MRIEIEIYYGLPSSSLRIVHLKRHCLDFVGRICFM